MNIMAVLSLIFLFAAIALGFFRKINIGIVAIGFSLILGRISGVSDSKIISGFGYSLFVMLLGVMYLFSIAQINGTLELLAKKVLAVLGKKSFMIPIVIYLLAVILSAIGPGTIPVFALMAALTVALSIQMDINPVKLAPFGLLGSCAGGFSPIAPTGIIAISKAAEGGISGVDMPLFAGVVIGMTLYAIILFFVFKWPSMKIASPVNAKDLPAFNRQQLITLIGIIIMALLTLVFKVNVGLSSFVIAMILSILRVSDEGKAIAGVPWGTLIMISGMGILMNLVILLGGIDMLSAALASLMNKTTAAPIMTATGGILSWFSSTSGVVLPTLIPTIPGIVEQVPGANAVELITCISAGAHGAALSPLSTGGALVLASFSGLAKASPDERNTLFARMFIISILAVVFVSALSFTGLFRLLTTIF
ncbi:MAG: hypothetical protein Q4B67_06795 [Eubacteriales bacterium]|nr:hypothetical protein [Eubacteriales bacterium]